MLKVRYLSDYDECRRSWNAIMPRETIWDIWEIRSCFDRHYNRPRLFISVEERGEVVGLLPLSWIEESYSHGYFPGETWEGKTWIEQNRIPVRNEHVLRVILEHCPDDCHLRYLRQMDAISTGNQSVDEIGYLFYPPQFDYDIEKYFKQFSRKSIKRIMRGVADLEARGAEFRYNDLSDFDALVALNLNRYEERSYFHDIRFRESLQELVALLHDRGWLRLTAATIGNKPVAVDMGCVFNNAYTLLAGGTDAECPGIAKLINLHHMQWACEQRIEQVDFLCGEFSWKPMFHLTPRPLYSLAGAMTARHAREVGERRLEHAG